MANLKSENFQKLHSFTKSATLELLPYGNTMDTIKKNGYIESSKQLVAKVDYLKKYIDKYMAAMTAEVLEKFDYSVGDMEKEDDFENAVIVLENRVASYLTTNMKNASYPCTFDETWMLETVPAWLNKNGYEKQAILFADLKGKMALYSHIMTTYKTALENWIPKRISENYQIYISNQAVLEAITNSDSAILAEFLKDNEAELKTFTTIDGYCLTVSQNGIDYYNKLISGEFDEKGNKLSKGINELINEENQFVKSNNLNKKRLAYMKKLNKQVFSEVPKAFTIEKIFSDKEAIMLLNTIMPINEENIKKALPCLEQMLAEELYIKGNMLGAISHITCENANKISQILFEIRKEEILAKNITAKRKEKAIDEIPGVLNKSTFEISNLEEVAGLAIKVALKERLTELVSEYKVALGNLKNSDILSGKIKGYQDNVWIVKDYLLSVQAFRKFFSLFRLGAKDELGYSNELAVRAIDGFSANTKALNLIRNYITKGLRDDVKKLPMFFNTPLKLDAAWYKASYDKFKKNMNMLLRMDDKYYFLTLSHDTKPVIMNGPKTDEDVLYYMSIDKPQPMYQMLPKVTFSRTVKAFFENNPEEDTYILELNMAEPVVITRDIYEIKEKKLFSKAGGAAAGLTEEEIIEAKNKLLDLYHEVACNNLTWANFNFKDVCKDANDFRDLSAYFNALDAIAVSMKWCEISKSQVEYLVESGQALMFLITNQNMYKEKGRKTSYAKWLLQALSDTNVNSPNISINARPKIFYRPAILESRIAHKEGSELIAHTYNGETLPDDIRLELYQYYNGRRTILSKEAAAIKDKVRHYKAKKDIVYRERYTKEQFTIALSFSFNKQVVNDNIQVNSLVSENLSDKHAVLSLHRGVNHLISYVLMDEDGNLKEKGNFDVIKGLDYAEKLKAISKQRKADKSEDWVYDTKATVIKEQYLADVATIIAKKAVENNARILLEAVSKKSRQQWSKLDNQVFGKLEERLVNKLQCYSDTTEGFVTPYQFSNPSLKGSRKGLLYMVSSAGSSIDPSTGFVNLFNRYSIISTKKKREFLAKMDNISIKDSSIIFTFDYNNFDIRKVWVNNKQVDYTGKMNWTLTLKGEKTVYNQTKKAYEYIPDISEYALASEYINESDCVDIASLHNEAIELLYSLFDLCLSGTVKSCKEVEEEYKVSPVTALAYNGDIEKCILQYKRYMLSLANDDVMPDNNAWYQYLQNK